MRIGNSIGVSSRQFVKAVPATDPDFANVVLLMHMDGLNGGTVFTDVTGKSPSAQGGATTNTTTKKFGTASVYFDGAGDFLDTPNSTDFDFGTGDFTVEGWMNPVSTATACMLVSRGDSNLVNNSYLDLYSYTDGKVYATAYLSTGFVSLSTSAGLITAGTWYHIAFVREGTSFSVYVNGNRVATGTSALSMRSNSAPVQIGALDGVTYGNFYADDIRITKGVARYSGATYTVPTAAFPDN